MEAQHLYRADIVGLAMEVGLISQKILSYHQAHHLIRCDHNSIN